MLTTIKLSNKDINDYIYKQISLDHLLLKKNIDQLSEAISQYEFCSDGCPLALPEILQMYHSIANAHSRHEKMEKVFQMENNFKISDANILRINAVDNQALNAKINLYKLEQEYKQNQLNNQIIQELNPEIILNLKQWTFAISEHINIEDFDTNFNKVNQPECDVL